jgi:hypothetical protein
MRSSVWGEALGDLAEGVLPSVHVQRGKSANRPRHPHPEGSQDGVREIAIVAFVHWGVPETQTAGFLLVHVSFMSYGNVLNHHDLVATRCSDAL